MSSKIANDWTQSSSTFGARKPGSGIALLGACVLLLTCVPALMAQNAYLPGPLLVVSTVPSNGDVNPYGVAFVPSGFPGGQLNPGDILVSNFNNNQNLQGTGTTIVRVTPLGATSVFFTAQPNQQGLSTALWVAQEGLVIVGNFPSTDGTCGTAGNGGLLVINSSGKQVQTITDDSFINGPWDMAVFDFGNGRVDAFIANGLTGAITRFDLRISGGMFTVQSKTTIASGYGFQCDPVTFVDAPTGLVYDSQKDLLYVASTVDNAIYAVADASKRNDNGGTGQVIYQDAAHLHGALAMAPAPNGHLLVSNNDAINPDPNQPSEIVEFTLAGKFVTQHSMDPNFGGSFGLSASASRASSAGSRFAAVDDNQSTLLIWTLPNH
jgi:hypothetical protein